MQSNLIYDFIDIKEEWLWGGLGFRSAECNCKDIYLYSWREVIIRFSRRSLMYSKKLLNHIG